MKTIPTRTTLKSNKPLKSKKTLRPKLKPKKQKLPNITKLKRDADKHHAHYIRLRDAELVDDTQWIADCISCGTKYVVRFYDPEQNKWRWGKQENAGHFVGRGNYYLRYAEENVNDQCVRCNKWLNGNLAAYATNLDLKYGYGTAHRLINEASTHKTYSLKREELEEIIRDSKAQIDFYMKRELV